jgi:hypothetical protein
MIQNMVPKALLGSKRMEEWEAGKSCVIRGLII